LFKKRRNGDAGGYICAAISSFRSIAAFLSTGNAKGCFEIAENSDIVIAN